MNPLVNVIKLDYQYLLEKKVETQHKIEKSNKLSH